MKIELLNWDSDFFGKKVGKLILNKDDEWDKSKLKKWDLVYIFVEPTDQIHNSILQEEQIPLVDEKITFLMSMNSQKINEDDLHNIHSYFSSGNDDNVIHIGVQSGIFSRFNVDPKITRSKFEELYAVWMHKSIAREIADEVLVYKTTGNEIAGTITIGEKNGRADIGIIAVDNNFRGQNIGRKLIQSAINYTINRRYTSLQVVTQRANKNACEFYKRCGFTEEYTINIFHYWN